jgi:signal transduction histidine kinase
VDAAPVRAEDLGTRRASAPTAPEGWEREREQLLEMLAHQQRVAQMGLITSGLVHDMNHHLMVMSGSAELALQSGDPGQCVEALERVKQCCRALDETARAFLGLVRRRAPQDTPTPIVDSVVQAGRLLRPLAQSHRVRLEVAARGTALLCGDARLLTQAIINLGSNALRACAGGAGYVEIRAGDRPLGMYRIEVIDSGPGIPDSVRANIFRPFATAHATSGGTGMGLFIVRQAVRRLGGCIRVRSSTEGTRFQIDVPTGAVRAPARAPSPPTSPGACS